MADSPWQYRYARLSSGVMCCIPVPPVQLAHRAAVEVAQVCELPSKSPAVEGRQSQIRTYLLLQMRFSQEVFEPVINEGVSSVWVPRAGCATRGS